MLEGKMKGILSGGGDEKWKVSDRMLFLFSDILVITKPNEPTAKVPK